MINLMSVSNKALDDIVKHVHGLHDVFILEERPKGAELLGKQQTEIVSGNG